VVELGKPNPVEALFYRLVVVAFSCKLLDVIQIVVNIVTVNAFFVDWEQVTWLGVVVVNRLHGLVL